jgi:hypothetical protein
MQNGMMENGTIETARWETARHQAARCKYAEKAARTSIQAMVVLRNSRAARVNPLWSERLTDIGSVRRISRPGRSRPNMPRMPAVAAISQMGRGLGLTNKEGAKPRWQRSSPGAGCLKAD